MAWTGDVVSNLNNIFKNVDMNGIIDIGVYENPFWARINKTIDTESFYTGNGYRMSLKTGRPHNARPRGDSKDVALPGKHTFGRMTIGLVEYVASTGITIKEQEVARRSATAVATLAEEKLSDLQLDMKLRMNNAVKGDGTGRLGYFNTNGTTGTGTAADPWVLTLANTGANWGIEKAAYFWEEGMQVDIIEPGLPYSSGIVLPTAGWNKWATNLVVSAINTSAGTVSLIAGDESAYATTKADFTTAVTDTTGSAQNVVVFAAGSVTLSVDATGVEDWSDSGISSWNEFAGLLYLIDDGTSSFNDTAGTGTGSYRHKEFQGVDRTAYRQLVSRVYNYWNGSSPGSWDLETLRKPIRDIDYGKGGGKVSAIYMHPDLVAATARKAWGSMNAIVQADSGEITGGFYTDKLRTDTGRTVPLIPCQDAPLNSAFLVCEEDYKLVMPNEIGFANPYDVSGKPDADRWFKSPSSRNFTYEAWLRMEAQLVAERCDNSARIDGLTTLE